MTEKRSKARKGRKPAREEYEVGYGKPPVATRFQKGKSGNPRGRPKGVKGFPLYLQDELNERVAIVENGRTKLVTKLAVMTKQFVNKAVKGESRSTEKVIELLKRLEDAPSQLDAETLSEVDDIVAQELMRRMKENGHDED